MRTVSQMQNAAKAIPKIAMATAIPRFYPPWRGAGKVRMPGHRGSILITLIFPAGRGRQIFHEILLRQEQDDGQRDGG